MATIGEYKSGEAAKAVRLAYNVMRDIEQPLAETKYEEIFKKKIAELAPIKADAQTAVKRVTKADRHAIGERICRSEFPGSPSTKAVFLDELADAMVEVEKPVYVSEAKAIAALKNGKKGPIIMSKVSGRYMEICITRPKHCFYWNCGRRGIKRVE